MFNTFESSLNLQRCKYYIAFRAFEALEEESDCKAVLPVIGSIGTKQNPCCRRRLRFLRPVIETTAEKEEEDEEEWSVPAGNINIKLNICAEFLRFHLLPDSKRKRQEMSFNLYNQIVAIKYLLVYILLSVSPEQVTQSVSIVKQKLKGLDLQNKTTVKVLTDTRHFDINPRHWNMILIHKHIL